MGKKLTVIFGAGASNDCVGLHPTSHVRSPYQPPLTKDIFEPRAQFSDILEKYPGALMLAARLRGAADRNGLENELRVLAESTQAHLRRQFRQVPLYLRELLGVVSGNYTNAPANYQHLVNRLLEDDFEKVTYITLNYDTILDHCLEVACGHKFKTMTDYVPLNWNWTYVKLHGSVNWVRRFNQSMTQGSLDTYLDFLQEIDLDNQLSGRIEIVRSFDTQWEDFGNGIYFPFFPALAIPVDNKYTSVCPDEVLDIARKELTDCQNFLVIGCACKDDDLMNLLRGRINSRGEVAVIGSSKEDATRIYWRLIGTATTWDHHPLVGGFSQFIESGQLDEWANRLR